RRCTTRAGRSPAPIRTPSPRCTATAPRVRATDMASADCECCGVPTTVGDPVPVEPEECDCGCYDCDDCEDCWHDDEPEFVAPVVLCDSCRQPDAPYDSSECGPGAWHCRCGRACDGSACPGEPLPPWITASLIANQGPEGRDGSIHDRDLRGAAVGGAVWVRARRSRSGR